MALCNLVILLGCLGIVSTFGAESASRLTPAAEVSAAVAAAAEAGEAAEGSTCGGNEDSESSCLLMRGSASRVPAPRSPDADEASSFSAGFKAACFKADLTANFVATPVNFEAPKSHAVAWIKVAHKKVDLTISWKLVGVSKKNPVIGLHIHKGDLATNGDILVGFCGQDPLPPFTGKCSQGVKVQGYQVSGATLNGTTLEDAAHELVKSKDPKKHFYLNLHTKSSFARTDGLGLIRGQLVRAKCPFR